jgi:hypothetical protein
MLAILNLVSEVASDVTNIGNAISEQERRMNCELPNSGGPICPLKVFQPPNARKFSTGCHHSISFSAKPISWLHCCQGPEGGCGKIRAFRNGKLVQEEHFGATEFVRDYFARPIQQYSI